MTPIPQKLDGHPALRWTVCGFLFLVTGSASSILMKRVLVLWEFLFSWSGGFALALGGGFLAWLAFHYSRRCYPFLGAGVIGLCCGIAGAGSFVLFLKFVGALMPTTGITWTLN